MSKMTHVFHQGEVVRLEDYHRSFTEVVSDEIIRLKKKEKKSEYWSESSERVVLRARIKQLQWWQYCAVWNLKNLGSDE